MFRFFCSLRTRTSFFQILALLLWFILTGPASGQSGVNILWHTDTGGSVLAYSANSQLLLAGLRLLDANNGETLRTFVLPYNGSGPNSVAISPSGEYAAIGIQAFNQNLDLFRVNDGALLAGRISAHSNGTTSVAFSPDGQLLATGGRDGTAKLWRIPEMTLLRTLNGGVGYGPRVFAIAFTRDNSMLAVGGQNGVVLFRVADGKVVRTFTDAGSTRALSVSPNNEFIISGTNAIDNQGQCTDCAIKTWRIADGALVEVIDAENNSPISITYSPDNTFIAAGSEDRGQGDGLVRFWRASDGVLVRSFTVSDGSPDGTYITSVAYSPDGKFLAYAGIDQHVTVIHNPIPNMNGSR